MERNTGAMKKAALRSMEDFNSPAIATKIGENAIAKRDFSGKVEYDWTAILSHLYSADKGVKRIKNENGRWVYYLANKEGQKGFPQKEITEERAEVNDKNKKIEKSLHKLFVSYLKNEDIHAKTISHEKANKREKNQNWTNPDIVGVKFLGLEEHSSAFLKAINKEDAFDIFSYELKIEITDDYNLKQSYFQAAANSSWANYGYLVAVKIAGGDNGDLFSELKRLNQLFGIGFIQLNTRNPFKSEIKLQAHRRNLDFDTISKMCGKNEDDFVPFIDSIKKIVEADSDTYEDVLSGFEQKICDREYFGENEDEKIKKYCDDNDIPIDDGEEE